MDVKSKGTNAERELVHMFWQRGWAAIRSAGSGSMKYPGPDILAGNKFKRMSVECKSTKSDKIYLTIQDVEQLIKFSEVFDARPFFAVRFPKRDWLFLNLEDLEKTEKGYVISLNSAERRGLFIDEIIR